MSFQFIHTETHALSRSKKATAEACRPVSEILAEVRRDLGACPHIEAPQPPIVLFGSLADIEVRLAAAIGQAKVVTGRKPRKDQRVLQSIVASYPPGGDPAGLGRWRELTLDYLRRTAAEDGGELLAVVEHVDEDAPHLHAYIMPAVETGLRADDRHPGKFAKAMALAAGESHKAANRAYRDAMRGYQDRYYAEVGLPAGLLRLGPGRQRKSRAGHLADKEEARRLADLHEQLAARQAEVDAMRDAVLRDQMRLSKDRLELVGERQAVAVERRQVVEERQAVTVERQQVAEERTRLQRLAADLAEAWSKLRSHLPLGVRALIGPHVSTAVEAAQDGLGLRRPSSPPSAPSPP